MTKTAVALLKPFPKVKIFSALLLCCRRICILVAVAALALATFDNVSPLTPVLPNLYVTVIGWEHSSKEIYIEKKGYTFCPQLLWLSKDKFWFASFTFPGLFMPHKGLSCPFTLKISQQCWCLCGVGEAVCCTIWHIVLQSYFIKTH